MNLSLRNCEDRLLPLPVVRAGLSLFKVNHQVINDRLYRCTVHCGKSSGQKYEKSKSINIALFVEVQNRLVGAWLHLEGKVIKSPK